MADRLAALLGHFTVSARTFQAGALCGINSMDGKDRYGQLHLIREGAVEVRHGRNIALRISQPSVLLYPRPMAHRFVTDRTRGADFVCAHLSFEGGSANPIAAALPSFVCLPLSQLQGSEPVLHLLFEEAAAQNCGRQAMLDRLFEVVLIQILRQLMEQGQTQTGMLSGLAHPQLRRALVAMHEQPDKEWSLEDLAAVSWHVTQRVREQFSQGCWSHAWQLSAALAHWPRTEGAPTGAFAEADCAGRGLWQRSGAIARVQGADRAIASGMAECAAGGLARVQG